MPPIKSHPLPVNKMWLAMRQREIDADLHYAWSKMQHWPAAWEIDELDRAYGQALLDELKPFVRYLAETKQLSRSTLRRHLDQLFLLGGELISRINTDPNSRRQTPARFLDQHLSPEGGPVCRHIDNDKKRRQFDATCKQLCAYRSG
jgi:hypothetical protein